MKLYEINARLEALIRLDEERSVDTETGEILTIEAVEALYLSKEEKIEACVRGVKNKIAEAEGLQKEDKKLKERAGQAKKQAEKLTGYVQVL